MCIDAEALSETTMMCSRADESGPWSVPGFNRASAARPGRRSAAGPSALAAVAGVVAAACAHQTVYTNKASAAPTGIIEVVAAQNGPVPTLPGATYRQLNNLLPPLIDADGRVLFQSLLGPIFIPFQGDQALLFGHPGELEVIVRNDGPAPGLPGKLRSFGLRLALAQDGNAGFIGQLETADPLVGDDDVGVWAGVGSAVLPSVLELDPIDPVQGLSIHTLTNTAAHVFTGGRTVFRGLAAGPGVNTANDAVLVLTEEHPAGAPRGPFQIVAREGSPSFDEAGNNNGPAFGTPNERVLLNKNHNLVFTSPLADGTSALFIREDQTTRRLARFNSIAPGETSITLQSPIDGQTPLALNNDGTLAMIGQLGVSDPFGGPTTSAVFAGPVLEGQTDLRAVLREGDNAPWGISGARFDQFFEVGLSDHKGSDGRYEILIRASARGTGINTNNNIGLLRQDSDGNLELIMRKGAQAPGYPAGVNITDFLETIAFNADGAAAFVARIGGQPHLNNANNRVVYLAPPNCRPIPLAQTGTTLQIGGGITKTVNNFRIEAGPAGRSGPRRGLSDNNHIALLATFTDGTSGIVTVRHCPADLDGDGVITVADYFIFLTAFFEQLNSAPPAAGPSADVNCSGEVNIEDYFDFLNLFFGGC